MCALGEWHYLSTAQPRTSGCSCPVGGIWDCPFSHILPTSVLQTNEPDNCELPLDARFVTYLGAQGTFCNFPMGLRHGPLHVCVHVKRCTFTQEFICSLHTYLGLPQLSLHKPTAILKYSAKNYLRDKGFHSAHSFRNLRSWTQSIHSQEQRAMQTHTAVVHSSRLSFLKSPGLAA